MVVRPLIDPLHKDKLFDWGKFQDIWAPPWGALLLPLFECEKVLLCGLWHRANGHTHKMALGQGLADFQCCHCEEQSCSRFRTIPISKFLSNHHYDENFCQDLPMVHLDGCSFHHESPKSGDSIVWVNWKVTTGTQDEPIHENRHGPYHPGVAKLIMIFSDKA